MQIDHERPLAPVRRLEEIVERVDRRCARAVDAHSGGDFYEIQIGIAEVEHVERLPARVAGPDIGQFALQDLVGAVGEQDGGVEVDGLLADGLLLDELLVGRCALGGRRGTMGAVTVCA